MHKEVATTLRSVGEEFDTAAQRGKVTEDLARKYHNALLAYGSELGDCPYSPMANLIHPTAYDSEMRGKMNAELARIQSEYSRIPDYAGVALALRSDGDIE